MRGAADLRAQAEAKRHMSGIARRVGPGLSLAADRLMMLQHAQELEAEAVGLEAQADALAVRHLRRSRHVDDDRRGGSRLRLAHRGECSRSEQCGTNPRSQ